MQFTKSKMYVLVAASGAVLLGASVDEARAQTQCQANELAKLLADDGASGDWFGYSIAVSGVVAVVGAYADDDNGNLSGSAYVYRLDNSNWVQQAKLQASDGAEGDAFGSSVAISGDTVVIGAPYDDDNGTHSGSAYVFVEPSGGWGSVPSPIHEDVKLTASDGAGGDIFGKVVAVSGDTAVIGAHGDDDYGECSGSAYVFRLSESGWGQVAKLLASDGEAHDNFGESVSISGDTVVSGAYWDNDSGYTSGSAYVFVEPSGGWDSVPSPIYEEVKLLASDGAPHDKFGWSVAVSGPTIVIGAVGYKPAPTPWYGSAYVYVEPDRGWGSVPSPLHENVKLTASDAGVGDYFGRSVAISGSVAMIGAPYDDNENGTDAGSAYVFVEPTGGWESVPSPIHEDAKVTASDGAEDDSLGISTAISGETAVSGAWRDDDKGSNSGSAYVFGGLSDCNENDTLDICDIADLTSSDCNGNSIPDECEIDENSAAPGGPFFCDSVAPPEGLDECDPDCNDTGIPDECELTDNDCNDDARPDECGVVDYCLLDFMTFPAALNANAASDSGEDSDAWPDIATDAQGNWVAVWYSWGDLGGTIGTDRDILFARSTDNGESWTYPEPLNTNASSDSGEDSQPQLTTDGQGNWVAVWQSWYGLSDCDILVARSTDNGASWTYPEPISDGPYDHGPELSTDGRGNWVAVWMDFHYYDDPPYNDILVAHSTDNGANWTTPEILNGNAADQANDQTPQVATDALGNWVAVWTSRSDLGGTIGSDLDNLVARSTDNGANWTYPEPLNTNAASDSLDDWDPQVATDAHGNWLAVWWSGDDLGGTIGTDWDILFSASTDNGASWTYPEPLNANAATDSGHDRYPQLTTDGQGNWVAVWHSYDDLGGTIGTDIDILFACSTDNGENWAYPEPLNANAASDSGDDRSPQATTDAQGNWVAAWYSYDDLGGTIGDDADILFSQFRSVGEDCNCNATADACDIADCVGDPACDDCNNNGVPDECDIAEGTSQDVNSNGIPDECGPCLDIKPGSCPNPFNRSSHGVLPAALLGTAYFDATTIDVTSIRLARADGIGGDVAPHEGPPGPQSVFEDVGTPFDGEPCDCHEAGADGFVDLSMNFKTDEVVANLLLDDLDAGALIELVVTGELLDGTGFAASDCVRLVPPGTPGALLAVESSVAGAWIDVDPPDETLDGGGFADFERTFPLTTVVSLTAEEWADGRPLRGWQIGGLLHHMGQTSVEFAIHQDMTARAVYGPTPSSGSPKPPGEMTPDEMAPEPIQGQSAEAGTIDRR